jgi:hypothetical protein
MTDIIRLADNCDYDALEEMGFFGIDASLEISLDEYGLALTPRTKWGDLGEVTVLYKHGGTWDCITQSPEYFTSKINESWFDKSGFFSFIDSTESRWLLMPLVSQIQDLIQYYGVDNIM